MFKVIFSSVLCLGLISCGPKTTQSNKISDDGSILGGLPAEASDDVAKSTVALIGMSGMDTYAFCTGTLISPDLIVTAAHCVSGNLVLPQIYFGVQISSRITSEELLTVQEIVTPKEFTLDSYNPYYDVALIKLQKPVPTDKVPVPILKDSRDLNLGEEVLLAGYGIVDDINQIRSSTLNKVDVPIVKIKESLIVTDQTTRKGACNGDSGGPAYLRTKQGLIVFGATRGPHEGAKHCHYFGEYSDLSQHILFIKEAAQKLNAQPPQFVDRKSMQ